MRTLFAVFLFLLGAGIGAQDEGIGAEDTDRLFIRPWIELQPLARFEPDQPQKPIKTAEQELLEEGRVLFSAMIYGWTFTYIPGDLCAAGQGELRPHTRRGDPLGQRAAGGPGDGDGWKRSCGPGCPTP